ncbi:MAG TPA: hypothetical protein VFA12_13825 [Stellaceae bacterium]|nr:hypothetical protein [Stellaceae bacterium]
MLLDTCAALWLANGDPLSPPSREAIAQAQAGNSGVFVSPITACEIGTLTIAEPYPFGPVTGGLVRCVAGIAGASSRDDAAGGFDCVVPSPGRSAEGSGRPDHRRDSPTRDGELTAYARSGHIQLIEC